MIHLRLLPTPPHGDAVTFSYGPENVCPKGTRTPLIKYTLRRTGPPSLEVGEAMIVVVQLAGISSNLHRHRRE
jgi:hypothetical protein